MTTNYEFNLTTSSSFSLSFNGEMGTTKWRQNGENVNKSMAKEELPQNTLFNISSLAFNIHTRKEESLNQYTSFYHPSLDALCLVFEQSAHASSFSRDGMLNLMDLAKKLGIKSIILLIHRKSHEYGKLVQGMMVVGFAPDKTKKMATIENQSYRILTMNVEEQSGKIEEVDF